MKVRHRGFIRRYYRFTEYPKLVFSPEDLEEPKISQEVEVCATFGPIVWENRN